MPPVSRIFSVKDINNQISEVFRQEGIFNNVSVRGEVGTLRPWDYGIVYLNLKEGDNVLPCQLSGACVRNAGFEIKNGMTITVKGSIYANTKKGTYILKVYAVTKENQLGEASERLIKLMEELKEEGLFEEQYKRPIPKYVKSLGVVTSETGAVINDVIRVSKERNPYVQIVLSPSKVSGDMSAQGMVEAINRLEEYGVDVIIIGRGGGSDEELWVYNNREIAEKVFNCSVPVISAVGHEINYQILDLVADLSVATPSHAAEKAIIDIFAEVDKLKNIEDSLNNRIDTKIKLMRSSLLSYAKEIKALSPQNKINQNKIFIQNVEERLKTRMHGVLNNKRHMLGIYIEKIKGLSPLDKLNQGYAYVSKGGITLNSIEQVNANDVLEVYVRDGYLSVNVEEKHEVKYE